MLLILFKHEISLLTSVYAYVFHTRISSIASNETKIWNPVILLSTVSKNITQTPNSQKLSDFQWLCANSFTHIKDAMKLKIVISFEQIDM